MASVMGFVSLSKSLAKYQFLTRLKIIKYNREDKYLYGDSDSGLEGINDRINTLMSEDSLGLKEHLFAHQMNIYDLLRPAIKINDLPDIEKIIKKIQGILPEDYSLDINVYINKSETHEAKATINQNIFGDNQEFIIILSQHFLNELSFEEQTSIVSHEVAHYYYNHTNLPYHAILYKFIGKSNVGDKIFINNLKKWSICKEISADLFSLQVTRDFHATAGALIKFTTGIRHDNEEILNILESQFQELKQSNVSEIQKEHPITLLRVVILKRAFEYFNLHNWKVDNEYLQLIIDQEVNLIYPELLFDRMSQYVSITYELGLLVGIADGEIDDHEIDFLCQIMYYSKDQNELITECNKLNHLIKNQCVDNETDTLRAEAFNYIKEEIPSIIDKALIANIHVPSIIRNLLTLASVDGMIDSHELKVIYLFAKEFGYSKGDVIQQMYNLN
jgi:hypothetical protein